MNLILTVASVFALTAFTPTYSAENAIKLLRSQVNLNDLTSLQRGAKYYMNYCLGCHSLSYMRYNRIADDLRIPIDLLEQNLIFITDNDLEPVRSGETLEIAMNQDFARDAFGNIPPDLSLVGRSRGSDWIFTYLKSFYLDEKRPYGVNNVVFPDVGMPHVLWRQQGWLERIEVDDPHASADDYLQVAQAGELNSKEFDQMVRDITAFLIYVSEPIQIHRSTYGGWVMLFMIFFTFLLWILKQEYWRDIK